MDDFSPRLRHDSFRRFTTDDGHSVAMPFRYKHCIVRMQGAQTYERGSACSGLPRCRAGAWSAGTATSPARARWSTSKRRARCCDSPAHRRNQTVTPERERFASSLASAAACAPPSARRRPATPGPVGAGPCRPPGCRVLVLQSAGVPCPALPRHTPSFARVPTNFGSSSAMPRASHRAGRRHRSPSSSPPRPTTWASATAPSTMGSRGRTTWQWTEPGGCGGGTRPVARGLAVPECRRQADRPLDRARRRAAGARAPAAAEHHPLDQVDRHRSRPRPAPGPASTDDLAVGHYKPINSERFLNDCHEFVFHFTPTGATPARPPGDRRAVPGPSNVGRWSAAAGGTRCRGNTWFIPYETIQSRDRERPHPATFPPRLPEQCLRLHGLEPPGTGRRSVSRPGQFRRGRRPARGGVRRASRWTRPTCARRSSATRAALRMTPANRAMLTACYMRFADGFPTIEVMRPSR